MTFFFRSIAALKILFLANRIPYPPYRGDKLKIYHLAKRLAKRHELHLLTFTEHEEEKQYRGELEKIFQKVELVHLPRWKAALHCLQALWNPLPVQVQYFRSAALRHKLNALLQAEKYDAVHVQHLRMAPYLADNASLPRILDLPDAFSLYWERRSKMPRPFLQKLFENIEQKRVLRYEQVLHRYDLALACSTEDLEYLQKLHGVGHLKLLSNGVDLDTFHEDRHDYFRNRTLLFTGNMDYAPNVDAVQYFVRELFPLILQRHPQTRFIIAGQKPVPQVLELASDKVTVTGFVPNLADSYREADVVVAPLRFGAGTQNKVLEAMAMGVPVVCSHIGFKGLGIESGVGAIAETDPARFTDAVCRLLDDASYREQVGTRGQAVIRNRFGWDAIAAQLEHYFREITGKTAG